MYTGLYLTLAAGLVAAGVFGWWVLPAAVACGVVMDCQGESYGDE